VSFGCVGLILFIWGVLFVEDGEFSYDDVFDHGICMIYCPLRLLRFISMHASRCLVWDVASNSWIFAIFACFIALIELGRYTQTFGNEVPFHCIVGTSYLYDFLVEPFDVILKRFALSLDNSFEGSHRLWLCSRSGEMGGELVAEVAPWVNIVSP
jgi:hypothetical protein